MAYAPGVALRLDDQTATGFRLLWARGMCSGVFGLLWAPIALEDGRTVSAIVFVVNPGQPLYEPDATVTTVARIVAEAAGVVGPNADRVHVLDTALADHGLARSVHRGNRRRAQARQGRVAQSAA